MKELSTRYVCSQCGKIETKWLGRCPDCGAWNSFAEEVVAKNAKQGKSPLVGSPDKLEPIALSEVIIDPDIRISTGDTELDRVLGGGMMRGGSILIGGEPGIGKSTLMLQMLASSKVKQALYISGEESASQVKLRSQRLGLHLSGLYITCTTSLETVLAVMHTMKPAVVVVDSLQTLASEELPSAPGTVNQIKFCAMELAQAARQCAATMFLVGHVTKDGQLAGPKVVEHIVDTVVYFDQVSSGVRIIRTTKNRFGSVDEIGLFLMGETGLTPVANPSGFFVSERPQGDVPSGIAFTAVMEGTRSFLVEIQALLVPLESGGRGRIFSDRIEPARISRIAAVLERHAFLSSGPMDIYVNVAGGMKPTEVGVDLPIALAMYSALSGKALPPGLVSVGELSLAGEIRPVGFGERRAKSATDMGFSTMLGPEGMQTGNSLPVLRCRTIAGALEIVDNLIGKFS